MSDANDRRMFAPIWRGDAMSPAAAVVSVLKRYDAGTTTAGLADELLRRGLAVGTRAPLTRRVAELLEDLEREARVERIPDGRYRAVRAGH